jgi:hypothetical protein
MYVGVVLQLELDIKVHVLVIYILFDLFNAEDGTQ